MAEAKTAVAHKPIWIDLSSGDAAGSRDFYSKLLGWKVEVNPDPQYGGYAMATIGGKDVAGIGPKQMDEAPTAWTIYVSSADAADTAKKAEAEGGKVIVPPMAVGEQGTMVILQDPTGAFIGVWQAGKMAGTLVTGEANSYGWAELNSRGVDKAVPFYKKVFGWGEKKSEMAPNQEYTEFLAGGESIAGGMEMNTMVPAEVPSYWQVYFTVEDVDKSYNKAKELGAQEILAPQDFAGGRFSIQSDPQGASFGLLKMKS
ncbi:MAG TPA: VOC family protein [Candidatus Nitrosotalea sp.]|nr:VOC family protein [Candidatus Nitrosotalea sp.]